MEIQTLDGIQIFVLPSNSVCYASDGCKNPLDLLECPCGRPICVPEGCSNYDEIIDADMRGDSDEVN